MDKTKEPEKDGCFVPTIQSLSSLIIIAVAEHNKNHYIQVNSFINSVHWNSKGGLKVKCIKSLITEAVFIIFNSRFVFLGLTYIIHVNNWIYFEAWSCHLGVFMSGASVA